MRLCKLQSRINHRSIRIKKLKKPILQPLTQAILVIGALLLNRSNQMLKLTKLNKQKALMSKNSKFLHLMNTCGISFPKLKNTLNKDQSSFRSLLNFVKVIIAHCQNLVPTLPNILKPLTKIFKIMQVTNGHFQTIIFSLNTKRRVYLVESIRILQELHKMKIDQRKNKLVSSMR